MNKPWKIVAIIAACLVLMVVVGVIAVHRLRMRTGTYISYCLQKPDSISLCDIHLERASTPLAQARGLGDRNSMPMDSGMIFEFPDEQVRCFWMKDMRFNIDMLWLDKDYKLVAKEINVSPDTYPKNYCPEQPAEYVVELNANVSKDWAVGSVLHENVLSAD